MRWSSWVGGVLFALSCGSSSGTERHELGDGTVVEVDSTVVATDGGDNLTGDLPG